MNENIKTPSPELPKAPTLAELINLMSMTVAVNMSKGDWDAVVKITQAQHNVTQSISVLGSFENLINRG